MTSNGDMNISPEPSTLDGNAAAGLLQPPFRCRYSPRPYAPGGASVCSHGPTRAHRTDPRLTELPRSSSSSSSSVQMASGTASSRSRAIALPLRSDSP
jgi:hypothetical protein